LAKRFLSRQGALWGAACYLANPYALLDIYMRSAFAELLACAVIPAVVLASLELSGLAGTRERSLPRATAFFAVAFAAIWLSNVPAGIMVSYSVALIFAWATVEERSLRPCWNGVKGLLLGFGLIGFYIVPVIYEQHWTSIAQMFPAGSFQFLYAQLDSRAVAGRLPFHWIASNVAVLLVVIGAAAGVAVYCRTEQQNSIQKKLWRVLLLLAATAIFLMTRLGSIFWRYLPNLFVMQFPWRWIGILAIAYALALAAALSNKHGQWMRSAVAIAIISGAEISLVKKALWNTEDIFALQQAVASDKGFFGWPEYSPKGVSFFDLPQNAPRVSVLEAQGSKMDPSNAQIRLTQWTAEEKNMHVTSKEPARVALRLFNYPAWRVEVNGKTVTTLPNKLDQVIVPVPAGESAVRVAFVRTPDRLYGDILSGASFLFLAIMHLASKRAPDSMAAFLSIPTMCLTHF